MRRECTEFGGSLAYRRRARKVLAGGVSSSPRAMQRPVPVVEQSAAGCTIVDPDGNEYTDYSLGYGPLLLGHSPANVIASVRSALDRGLRTGGITVGEAELAEQIALCVPSAEVSTFLSTGTEAVQLALRIARAATGRMRVVKFRGHYHGWADNIHLSNSPGSDVLTTNGQDPLAAANVISLDWGDLDGLAAVLDDSVAAVITEAAAINGGCFEPEPGFLEGVRALTVTNGSLLVFDEVITGFRVGLGGAQERYGVLPDLTVLGKVLGGGLPLSAVSGSAEAMDPISSGQVLHRGTFNGNPLSVAAGIACLTRLERDADELYPTIEARGQRLASGIRESAARHEKPLVVNQIGSCLQYFVSDSPVSRLTDLIGLDKDDTLAFSESLVMRGYLTLPRGLMYLSTEHTDDHIEATIAAFDDALAVFE